MPKENQPQKEQIKVTDKRIFTPDGELREEFREEIRPAADPVRSPQVAEKPSEPAPETGQKPQREAADRGRTLQDKAANPGTPFTNFLESLIAQAYMTLGMLPNPYQPQAPARVDTAAARQLIDILNMLQEKTRNNLTIEEEDFLTTHLGELKLAFVKRTKSVG